MLIGFRENVRINAPIEKVWNFILDPQRVVECMPGASLKEICGPDSFNGAMSVSFGGVSVQFNGTVSYVKVDRDAATVDMLASAKQYGGGSLSGTIKTILSEVGPDETDVVVESEADLKGGLVRAGKPMIEAMASEIIKQYILEVRASLEMSAQGGNELRTADASVEQRKSISVLSVLWSMLLRKLSAIVGSFRR